MLETPTDSTREAFPKVVTIGLRLNNDSIMERQEG